MRVRTWVATPLTLEVRCKYANEHSHRKLMMTRCFFPKAPLPCIGFVEWSTLRKIISHEDVEVFSIQSSIVIDHMTLYAVGFNKTNPAVNHFDIKYFLRHEVEKVKKELTTA